MPTTTVSSQVRRNSGGTPWHVKTAIESLVGVGPTFPELLRGGSFVSTAEADGADLAGWLLQNHIDGSDNHLWLAGQLTEAKSDPTAAAFEGAANSCRVEAAATKTSAPTFAAAAVLFDYFGAALGGRKSALRVAAEAIVLSDAPGTTDDQALDDGIAALGWLAMATSDDGGGGTSDCPRTRAAYAAERVFDRMMRAWRRRLQPGARGETKRQSSEPWLSGDTSDGMDGSFDFNASDEAPGYGDAVAGHGLVALRGIGGASTTEGRRVAKRFQDLVGAELQLVPVKDLASVRCGLLQSYPHVAAIIDVILGELVGRKHVRLPPIVLVGPPGCGKTRFAGELLQVLGVPRIVYSCGGSTDGSLGGNSRRWATGEPSLPVAMLDTHRVASPGIVLDELEKAGSSTQNGRLHDVLLTMLEPVSAVEWHDPYLQAPVDLSHVVWIATANTLDGIPAPLRDRCRILAVPAPGPEHLQALAPALLRQACTARGLDPRWATPLDGIELDAVARAWPGGSVRRLVRLLEGVVAARNHAPVLQ